MRRSATAVKFALDSVKCTRKDILFQILSNICIKNFSKLITKLSISTSAWNMFCKLEELFNHHIYCYKLCMTMAITCMTIVHSTIYHYHNSWPTVTTVISHLSEKLGSWTPVHLQNPHQSVDWVVQHLTNGFGMNLVSEELVT